MGLRTKSADRAAVDGDAPLAAGPGFDLLRRGVGAHTGWVELVLVVVGMLALPWVLGRVVLFVRHQCEQVADQRRPVTTAIPIERVAADLRRLRAELEARENGPGSSGKGMRMGAVRLAYVEVLAVACRQLDITPPRTGAGSYTCLAEIYRIEADLRRQGLDVRLPAHRPSRAA